MEYPFSTWSCADLATALASPQAPLLLDCRHLSIFSRSHIRTALPAPSVDHLSDAAFVVARLPRPQRAECLAAFTLQNVQLSERTLVAIQSAIAQQSGVCVYDAGSIKVEQSNTALPLLFAIRAAGAVNISFLSGGISLFSFRYPDLMSSESLSSFDTSTRSRDDLTASMQNLSISNQQPESLSTADAQLVQLLCPPVQLKGDDDEQGDSITEVLPGRLYLGTAAHAHDENALNALSISVLVNCAAEITNPTTSRLVCNARLHDQNNYPIADFFDMFFHSLQSNLASNQVILVHCRGGDSRAPALLLSFLIRQFKLSLYESYVFLKFLRPSICPNEGFMLQLSRSEPKLLNQSDCSIAPSLIRIAHSGGAVLSSVLQSLPSLQATLNELQPVYQRVALRLQDRMVEAVNIPRAQGSITLSSAAFDERQSVLMLSQSDSQHQQTQSIHVRAPTVGSALSGLIDSDFEDDLDEPYEDELDEEAEEGQENEDIYSDDELDEYDRYACDSDSESDRAANEADNDAADLQDLESQRQPEMLVTPEMAAAVPGVTRASQFATFRVRSGRVPRTEGEEPAFVYPNGQMPTAPPRDFVRLPKLYYEEPEQ